MRQTPETIPLEAYARGIDSRSLGTHIVPTLRYMLSTEVHTYAFSIAANIVLAFVPFTILLLSFSRDVLHSDAAFNAVIALLKDALPSHQKEFQDFFPRNLSSFALSHKTQAVSLLMLLFTSNGVMLPLEVALNRIWRIPRNRSFLMNQVVSYGLAFCCALCALLAVLLTAVNSSVINGTVARLGWTGVAGALLWFSIKLATLPATILVFFLLYYFLPNGKVPFRPMVFAAVFAGAVAELAKYVFIWLLPWLNFQDVYGPFFVRSATLLIWSYAAAMVMLVSVYFAAYGAVEKPPAEATPAPPQP
jgi:YihY family inner membrane protein